MKAVKRLLIGIGAAVVLLAVLSVTLLNKQAPHMRMTSLMRDGRLAMDTRDYTEAVDVYRLAISLDGRSVPAYLALAEARLLDGEPEDALYYLRQGMEKTSSSKVRDAYNDLLKRLAVSDPPDIRNGGSAAGTEEKKEAEPQPVEEETAPEAENEENGIPPVLLFDDGLPPEETEEDGNLHEEAE
ncbi:MAG: hypothetical protein LBI19_07615 [Oscillospiraceae bacterium]|jgi:tetratricopeptide (TPR) repeat protein|nr:hypothetical protein [Oscillospiraceae bacterium]